ncbi:hypothetical protein ACFU7T_05010 [Streptomyces sp. NPDC057555]|uniref:hypothetical protein n=1 Tax=Streptomyces sp. NPDC057555 TaxID=3346166 RepID=UPI0036A7F8EB
MSGVEAPSAVRASGAVVQLPSARRTTGVRRQGLAPTPAPRAHETQPHLIAERALGLPEEAKA